MARHIIVYSHGFGVRQDDRGLFTDIAEALPEAEHIMFDYNLIDGQTNTLTVSPLQEQSRKLQEQLEKIDSDATVDIVAHSQGSVVTAIAKPHNVRKIICIAPPDSLKAERLISLFSNRKGSVIDLNGQSRIPRRDDSTTIIPAAYWQNLQGLNAMRLYNRLLALAEVKFIIANEDEVLGVTNFDQADDRIGLIQLSGNHDFSGDSRQHLVEIVKNELVITKRNT